MFVSQLKIKGFRSFGSETTIFVKKDLAAFIGLNSSGKTSALDALRKVFGTSNERDIRLEDFHIKKDEDPAEIESRELSIEVKIDFETEEKENIPHFFSYMVVDEEGADPYLRIRLEANWQKIAYEPEGSIDIKTYYIKISEDDTGEEIKQLVPSHFKMLFQILYVPAIRRPAEQLKYASGSILYRVLRKIKYEDEFREKFDETIAGINEDFRELPELITVEKAIRGYWERFHKDERYKDTELGFGGSDFDSILKKIEISFSPTPTHRKFNIEDLGEGYRSLFYLTLVCALLEIEEKFAEKEDEESIGINRPLMTILAIEEPENHIAPQLLGRVVSILKEIAKRANCQVVLSSHTPAIVKRLDPESIHHFRITEEFETQVSGIVLPKKLDEAYKYIKEAIYNYPEIYFSKLVVIGEGDTEEVVFNRLMEVRNTDFDDNIITFAPLGHRFVNHIWRLLKALNIPYLTLLDLDTERYGGAWGRVKYALNQLIENGVDKNELLKLSDGSILSDEELEKMHEWTLDTKKLRENLESWVNFLTEYRVYFSAPLDLDFLMLEHYTDFYKKAIPKGGGPEIPDKDDEPDEFEKKIETGIHATLKSDSATAETYSEDQKELMIWYNYHFLGRGKPSTHIHALSLMTNQDVLDNLPPVIDTIFDEIQSLL
ncbi:ATP-dependent endonuclease [Mucilaginibacter sp. OK283]|jgi:predicted ATP-dependent endonuclease of OLD family|uniref:ATP-dependent nuclease n=1 Tax=Mucilaginibacter sp. OK283 TaxID=1881049 RepID=UPI0008D89F62|nr:AAA family ATPase [Mucilaginibacter sp. OK283]SEO77240.1 Predicted ATP-dependent endonuclease of the OLD family, contains P-loop ATPase and TOPRIM domains [Mucilaginibacter sp. OK283]